MSGFGKRFIDGLRFSLGVKPYLSSGLIDLRFAILNPSVTEEGILYRNDTDVEIDEEKLKTKEPMPESEQPSRSFGMPSLYKPEATESQIEQDRYDCYVKSVTASVCPASYFTGKLKYWVQAIYGDYTKYFTTQTRLTDDYRPFLAFVSGDSVVDVDWGFGLSCGLYTSSTDHYYLVRVSYSTAEYFKVKLTAAMRKLLKRKGDFTDEEFRKVEGYILSKCKIDYASRTSLDYFTPVSGEPIGKYGWHFNWKGNEAHLCTNEYVEETTPDVYYRLARLYKLTIDEDFIDEEETIKGPVSLAVEKLEEVEYRPRQSDNIWFYSYSLAMMEGLVPPSGINAGAAYGTDAPIYCYYNSEDELIVTRYRYEGSTAADPGTLAYNTSFQLNWICNPTFYRKEDYLYGDVVNVGFYNESVDETWSQAQYIKRIFEDAYCIYLYPEDLPTNTNDTIIPNGGNPSCQSITNGPNNGIWVRNYITYKEYQYVVPRPGQPVQSFDVVNALIIPDRDASSVYLLKKSSFSSSLTKGGSSRTTGIGYYYYTGTSQNWVSYNIQHRGFGVWSQSDTLSEYNTNVTMTGNSIIEAYAPETASSNNAGWWAEFLTAIDLNEPYVEKVVASMQNLNNDAVYTEGSAENTYNADGDYPYHAGSVFVGWS